MIQHCLNQQPLRAGDGPMALVLAPTRELAQQIEREVSLCSRCAPQFERLAGRKGLGEGGGRLDNGVGFAGYLRVGVAWGCRQLSTGLAPPNHMC